MHSLAHNTPVCTYTHVAAGIISSRHLQLIIVGHKNTCSCTYSQFSGFWQPLHLRSQQHNTVTHDCLLLLLKVFYIGVQLKPWQLLCNSLKQEHSHRLCQCKHVYMYKYVYIMYTCILVNVYICMYVHMQHTCVHVLYISGFAYIMKSEVAAICPIPLKFLYTVGLKALLF